MPNLLIVDDETALVRVLKEAFALKLPGIDVHSAETWDEAMAIADELDGLHLLVTDHHLNAHSGLDLCKALRVRFPGLRMLLYTGKAGPKVEAAAREVGARVIWKPQRLATLVAEVQAELNEHSEDS